MATKKAPKADQIRIEIGGYKTQAKLFEEPKKKHKKAKGGQMGMFDNEYGGHQPTMFNPRKKRGHSLTIRIK